MAKILVVHDDRTIRHAIAKMLRNSKLEVLEAVNGLAGLQAVIHGKPDLVVSGLQMNRMSGIEMALRLRQMGFKVPVFLYCEPLIEELAVLAREAKVDLVINERESGTDGLLDAVKECLAEAEKKKGKK